MKSLLIAIGLTLALAAGAFAGCPADVNNDGVVDAQDAQAVKAELAAQNCKGGPGCPADVNGDGVVNLDDVRLIRASIGQVCQ